MWRPGQSGNPRGRKSLGAYVSEHLNSFATWTPAQLRKRLKAKDVTAAELLAIRRLLSATGEGTNAGADFDRVCDRTGGKPVVHQQTVNEEDAVIKRIILEDRRVSDTPHVPDVIGGEASAANRGLPAPPVAED